MLLILSRSSPALLALALAGPALSAEEPGGAAKAACDLPIVASGTVRDAVDGRTLVLEDGRTVRLLALDVPTDAEDARGALADTVRGRAVVLKSATSATDRYGRVRARAFVLGEGLERSVEEVMLQRGLGRVLPVDGDRRCSAALLAAERGARNARLGLWNDARFAPRDADDPKAVAANRGQFTLIEGTVRSVRESGGTIYVNFGARWSDDFTVTIAKRNERSMRAAGLEPMRLQGRRVLVRGWVEERGGPWIDVTQPEQIEIISGP